MDKMDALRLEIAEKLCEIEDILKERGLETITGLTLVARNPDNPVPMHVILTNGGDEEIAGAAELLQRN